MLLPSIVLRPVPSFSSILLLPILRVVFTVPIDDYLPLLNVAVARHLETVGFHEVFVAAEAAVFDYLVVGRATTSSGVSRSAVLGLLGCHGVLI